MDKLKTKNNLVKESNKVLDVLKNKSIFIKRLEKKYNADLSEFTDTIEKFRMNLVGDYQGVKNPTRKNAEEFVKGYSPNGEYEDSAYEAGHLAGVESCIRELKIMGDKDNDKTKFVLEEKQGTIDNKRSLNRKELKQISEKYAEKFLEGEINDVETIYNFLNYINGSGYYGKNEIILSWANDNESDDKLSFDVFYTNRIGNQEYRTGILYIEWLEFIESKESVSNELIKVADRVDWHIAYLDNNS